MRTCSALGLAKIVPATAAVRRPRPTKEEKEGSWPEPPPLMRAIVFGVGEERYTILLVTSTEREGLVKERECRAEWTSWVGSRMKCFVDAMVVLRSR